MMLDGLIERRPETYVRHVEGLWRDDRLQAQLRVLGLLTTGRARLYVFPVSLAETVEALKPMTSPLRDGSGKYSSCSLGSVTLPSKEGRIDIIVTPDDGVEAVYLSHEVEHLALGRLGMFRIRGRQGTPGMAVERFATWVEEAAVSARSREFSFDPTGPDRERVEGGLQCVGARGEGLKNIYEIEWSAQPENVNASPVRIRLAADLLGELAGLTYLAATSLQEKDAAEMIYRARCFQVDMVEHTLTTLPDILAATARWGRAGKPHTPRDIQETVERFSAALRWDLAGSLQSLAGERPTHATLPG